MDGLPPTLGRYQLLRRLGLGGMAQVHLARAAGPAGFERLVALKTLSPAHRGDPEMQHRLLDEGRLGAALSHRNLVEVLDLGHDGGEYFLVLSLLDAGDLATVTGGRAMPAPLALWIAHEVALALAYLHAAADARGRALGLVHRDISPHNVLLSRSGQVCLGDLGIAKATSMADRTGIGLRRGKYAYMAPEQVRGERVEASTDHFALGVVLYELLVGARPYEGSGPLEVLDRLRDAAPPELGPVPEAHRALLARMLGATPAQRFASDRALVHALERALREEPCTGPLELAEHLATSARGPAPQPAPEARTRPLSR